MRWSSQLGAARMCALAFALGASVSCREPTHATQVLVRFEADDALVARARALRLTVFREDAAPWRRTERLGDVLRLPTTLPLEPLGGDATRRFHVLGELLGDEDVVLGTERAIGGYDEAERRHVTLRFTSDCEARECDDERACVAGACASACVETARTVSAERTSPVPCPAGSDAGVDASMDAGDDAGERDAGVDASDDADVDADVDAGSDAGTCAPVRSFDLAPNHLCVLLDGGVLRCAGANGRGALGIGNRAAVVGFAEPVAGGPWRELVVGDRATCALDESDALFCWGDDPGRLGLVDADADTTQPQPVTGTGGTTRFRRAALGVGHGCAPRFADPPSIYCFGRNDFGQAGGTPSATLVAPAASPMLGSAFLVATGDTHTCAARTTTPSVVCWGENDFGQLATPSETLASTGTPQSAGLRAFALAAGADFTCALRDPDGRPVCWGDNRNAQCGATVRREIGRTVVPLDAAVTPVGIDAGDSHACVVSDDGAVWCWGANASGQLGIGVAAGPSTPTPQRALGGDYVAVRTSADRTCALGADGTLFCWGRGEGRPTPLCVE